MIAAEKQRLTEIEKRRYTLTRYPALFLCPEIGSGLCQGWNLHWNCRSILDYRMDRSCIFRMNIQFYLWKAIIAFEHYPFQLLGCGEDHSMAIKFTYETSTTSSAGGRHYSGISVKGYGNEMWIVIDGEKREKSISRFIVELELKNALEEQKKSGFVSNPRKLETPGCRSYLYSIFLRFGVITSADASNHI